MIVAGCWVGRDARQDSQQAQQERGTAVIWFVDAECFRMPSLHAARALIILEQTRDHQGTILNLNNEQLADTHYHVRPLVTM